MRKIILLLAAASVLSASVVILVPCKPGFHQVIVFDINASSEARPISKCIPYETK